MTDHRSPPPPNPPEGVDWKSMGTAQRDGTIIAVRFKLWNRPGAGEGIQLAQWLNGAWRPPFDFNGQVYADAWALVEEVNRAQEAAA